MATIYYSGSGANISLTVSSAVNAIEFWIANKGEITPLQKFAYPAKTGCTTLVKNSLTYTAVLDGTVMQSAKENMLIYSLKVWDTSDLPLIDEGDIAIVKTAIISKATKPV